jgi:hypothetical protein
MYMLLADSFEHVYHNMVCQLSERDYEKKLVHLTRFHATKVMRVIKKFLPFFPSLNKWFLYMKQNPFYKELSPRDLKACRWIVRKVFRLRRHTKILRVLNLVVLGLAN